MEGPGQRRRGAGTGCSQEKPRWLLAQGTPLGRTGGVRLVGKDDKQGTPRNILSRGHPNPRTLRGEWIWSSQRWGR